MGGAPIVPCKLAVGLEALSERPARYGGQASARVCEKRK